MQIETQLGACGDNLSDFSCRLGNHLLEGPLNEQIIPRKDLVIFPGRFVWLIYVDIVFLTIGGLSVDIASFAMLLALRDTKWVCPISWSTKYFDDADYQI